MNPIITEEKKNTLKDLAKEALAIQSACNLCGLAQRFAEVMREINSLTTGTDESNRHPIVTLWVDKMVSLNGYLDGEVFTLAYDEVTKLTNS